MTIWQQILDWIVPDRALRWGHTHTSWADLQARLIKPEYRRVEHHGWTRDDFHARSNYTTGRCPHHGTFGGSAPQCRYPTDPDGTWCGLPLVPQPDL